MGATIHDMEEAELCYAPPFGGAKDPVNFAGMVAADILRGDMPIATGMTWTANPPRRAQTAGTGREQAPGAVNIPLGSSEHNWANCRKTARSS